MKTHLLRTLLCTAIVGCLAAAPMAFAEPKEEKAESAWKAGPEGQRPPRPEGGKRGPKEGGKKRGPADMDMGMGMGDEMMPPPPPPMGGPEMAEMDRPARRLMQRFVQMRVENEKLSRMEKSLDDEAERLNDPEKGGKFSEERRARALKINGMKRELLVLEREEFVAKVKDGSVDGLEQIDKLRTRLAENDEMPAEMKARMSDRLEESQANIEKIRDSATDFESLSKAIKEVRVGPAAGLGDSDRTEREREVIMRRLEELERRIGGPGERPDGMMERGMRRGPGGPERMEGGEMEGPPPRRRGIDQLRERRQRPGGEEGAPPPPPPPAE